MRRFLAVCLSAVLALTSAAPVFAEEEIGNGVYATYDEAYYANLDYYGNLKDASVVKSYILNGVDTVTDYGEYDAINNLTDGTAPSEENGAHVFRFGADAPGHFYFEGKTDKPFEELPWTVSVSYKLNGVPTKAEDLAGKTGMIEIDVDAVPRETASEYARNNYTLEVMGLFNQDDILSLKAPGAQVQLIGNLRAVLFLGLPGEEEHFVIEVGAEDFAFDGLTMLMVPANLGALEQISDLSDRKDQLEDNYHKLDSSIDTLLNSFSGMSQSLRETADGLDELNEGRAILSEDKEGLYAQADAALDDADALRGDLQTASQNAADLQKTVDDVTADLTALNGSLGTVSEDLTRLSKALTDLDKDLSLLQSYSRGSGSDMKGALRALSRDAAALRDSLGGFTETLSLLDVQVGGKDITVQGIPSQDLAAQSKKAQAVLDLYDAVSAIAPIDNADMFTVAANAMASGSTPAESAAALQQQKEQLTQAVTAVIMGSQGAIPDQASALAYIKANAANDPSFAAIAAALQKQSFLQALYAQTVTGKDGLMTEEDFMTALLMAQDETLSGVDAYRASVRKSFALMDAMQDGLMVNLASLCDSLSKGTGSAADLIGSQSGNLSKRAKDAMDDFDTVMTRTENLLTKTGELLKNLEAAGKTAEDAAPDLKADLADAQTLLTDLNKTAADTTGLLRSFEGTMKNAGVKLDEGTKKTLEGLAVTLRKLADSTDTTGSVRAAKNGVSDIVEDVWNDYTGKLNNLLLMDPSAPAQSLTDSRNEAPQTIQVMLRTQEIKAEAPEGDSPAAAPQETDNGSDSVWHRILELFSGIRDDIAGLFRRDSEEAAEL